MLKKNNWKKNQQPVVSKTEKNSKKNKHKKDETKICEYFYTKIVINFRKRKKKLKLKHKKKNFNQKKREKIQL